MSPKETGIEESQASFRKIKKTSIRDMTLTAYEGNQINEKLAYILLCIADKVEGKRTVPTPVFQLMKRVEKKEGK